MGSIHVWGLESQLEVGEPLIEQRSPWVLRPGVDSSIDQVADEAQTQVNVRAPDYIITPDKGNSRDNSITAAYISNALQEDIPVIVPIRGTTRRERIDFLAWLIENNYVPAFPRMQPTDGRSFPLSRHEQIVELREPMEKLGPWIWAVLDWHQVGELESAELMRIIPGQWEAFIERSSRAV